MAKIQRSQLGKQLNLKILEIPAGRPNRPGSPLRATKITIHNTDNTSFGADAEKHSKFLNETGYYIHNGKKISVSWHYTVDDDSCVRHLPLNEVGWHAGKDGNANSIGIEICMNAGIDQSAAFDRAIKLIACLCFDMGLDPSTDVVPHMTWTGKKCPSLLLDKGKVGAKWQSFIGKIAKLEGEIQPG